MRGTGDRRPWCIWVAGACGSGADGAGIVERYAGIGGIPGVRGRVGARRGSIQDGPPSPAGRDRWGLRGLNPGPADYESDALTD